MDQTVPYLAGASSESAQLRSRARMCLLKLEPTARFTKFLVTGPDPKTKPRLVPRPATIFSRSSIRPDLGIWSVKATAADNRTIDDGVQLSMFPEGESKFDPIETQDLDTIFGKDNYKLAEDVQTLEKIVTIGRLGHEMFPWLMFLILIVVTLENFLANTFYKQAPERMKA